MFETLYLQSFFYALAMCNTEEEEDNPYLVDFQQKYIDKALRHREADGAATNTEKIVEDDDWYVCVCIIYVHWCVSISVISDNATET